MTPVTVIVVVSVRVRVAVVRVAVMIVILMYVLHAGRYGHVRRGLRVELLADQQHQSRAEQRKQRYQPDVIEKVHVTTSRDRSGPPGPSLYCETAR